MTETSKEYASALFQLALEQGQEEEIAAGMKTMRGVFEQTPEYAAFLSSPGIPKQKRLDAIHEAFDGAVPEYAVSLLCLMCQRGCADLLPACAEEYQALYAEHLRRSYATVTSAVELTDGEKEKLRQKLERISGHTVRLRYQIDPALLGGVTVEMDGTLYDGSLRSRLQTMKEVISQ